jgi:hypothetical protein
MLALEEFHLAQPFQSFRLCLVRPAQVAALRRQRPESALSLYDHRVPPGLLVGRPELGNNSPSPFLVMMPPAMAFPQEHRRGADNKEQQHEEIVLDDHIGLPYITIHQPQNSCLHSQKDVTHGTRRRDCGHKARQIWAPGGSGSRSVKFALLTRFDF